MVSIIVAEPSSAIISLSQPLIASPIQCHLMDTCRQTRSVARICIPIVTVNMVSNHPVSRETVYVIGWVNLTRQTQSGVIQCMLSAQYLYLSKRLMCLASFQSNRSKHNSRIIPSITTTSIFIYMRMQMHSKVQSSLGLHLCHFYRKMF
jgi:hypothetical protein